MNRVGYTVHGMNGLEREEELTRELLQAIDQHSNVTQRGLAHRMGVALGLANSYLNRCVRKGLIKIQQVPPNRYLYYLTPQGFAEKSRLTGRYLADSFHIYRRASESYEGMFADCARQGLNRLTFCGVSELAEIASIRAGEHPLTIPGIFDPESGRTEFLQLPVFGSADEIPACDALVLTTLRQPEAAYRRAQQVAGKRPVLVPEFLEFVRARGPESAGT